MWGRVGWQAESGRVGWGGGGGGGGGWGVRGGGQQWYGPVAENIQDLYSPNGCIYGGVKNALQLE